jgi:hypothetical protein
MIGDTYAEGVIQFAIRQESGIGRDHAAAKPNHQTTVEIGRQRSLIRFTRRVRYPQPVDPPQVSESSPELDQARSKSPVHPGNAGSEEIKSCETVPASYWLRLRFRKKTKIGVLLFRLRYNFIGVHTSDLS